MQPIEHQLKILTNMALWQDADWRRRTTSIYPVEHGCAPAIFMPWWREVVVLLQRAGDFNVVLTEGTRVSLAYGLACMLLGRQSRQIMTEILVDDVDAARLLWRLKVWLHRLVAKRSLGVLVNSSVEVDTVATRYDLPPARIRFVPWHTNMVQPRRVETTETFALSAGRSLRDYGTLLKAAEHISQPIMIVCGTDDITTADIPAHVTVLREIGTDEYLALLARCACVVLPLINTTRSTGQVAMLEAMALGKPVIATRSPGTIDYIQDGDTGLLVPPGDSMALAAAMRRLSDEPGLGRRLADNALNRVRDCYTFSAHVNSKLAAIADLWEKTCVVGLTAFHRWTHLIHNPKVDSFGLYIAHRPF